MVFVSEVIPEEARSMDIFSNMRNHVNRPFRFSSDRQVWIIDRDRNVFMFHVSSGGYDPQESFFCLAYNGVAVNFKGILNMFRKNDINYLAWKDVHIWIPAGLDGHKQQIESLIEEALIKYGFNGRTDEFEHVSVGFL